METTGYQSHKHNKMVGIEIDGVVKIFKSVPKTWTDENGLHLNIKDGSAFGFKSVIKPNIDSDTQSLGNLYLDADNDVYTREIIEKDFDATYEDEDGNVLPSYDLDGKKAELIKGLKATSGSLLSSTDWQVVRLAERGIAIDAEVASKRQSILDKCDSKEIEVNALDSFLGALKYNTSFYTEQLDENGDVIVDELGNPILAI